MFWSIFFQNSPFQTKSDFVRIFSRNIYSTNFRQYLLSYFLERKQIPKILLFFNSRLNNFWSRVQQKHPDEKSVGDPENQSWESNLGQQWLSRTGQIKNFQGFCWEQNFVLFTSQTWRDNSDIFKQVILALCLLKDEEILRLKKGRKNIKLLLKILMIAKVRNA